MDKKVNQIEKGIHNEENSSYEELIHQVYLNERVNDV